MYSNDKKKYRPFDRQFIQALQRFILPAQKWTQSVCTSNKRLVILRCDTQGYGTEFSHLFLYIYIYSNLIIFITKLQDGIFNSLPYKLHWVSSKIKTNCAHANAIRTKIIWMTTKSRKSLMKWSCYALVYF